MVKMCKVLGISKSGYYGWRNRPLSERAQHRQKLTIEVKRIYDESNQIYGSPKIHKQLNNEGIKISERTVQRIMSVESIRSKTVRKYKATTNSDHDDPIYPNIINQDFTTTAPGEVWVADITYVWTKEGWLYLASVMDLFSRKIIGFNMGSRLTKELAIRALERAMINQPPSKGLIHHSDRGSQYASIDYTNKLKEAEIIISMSRKGNCYDNACIESFHSSIKKELIYQKKYKTRDEAKMSIFNYLVGFYNSRRIHSTLGYISPNEFEKQYLLKSSKA
ncbi:transposase InsO family protein [Neobacillus cucumis]|nr:transposase InsO family protein [Neobacillus cucumis]